jgi:hypothetical protein
LLGAEIRINVAQKDLDNQDLQISQSAEVYDWMKNKYSNEDLYTWMAGELKTLHRHVYDLAYDMAKQAQQAYARELGTNPGAINFGYWDSSRAGLLAGERLSSQLKELESTYIKSNSREYELTKNISLRLLDPIELETLKATGSCSIHIPELLFDLDYLGHYYRRIKSVSISIPGIAGPNTNINATLTLTNHTIRTSHNLTDPVLTDLGYGESIVTSSAQNDSGLFEMNLRDERYVPFEGKGAISEWTLDLSQVTRSGKPTVRQFDFSTIADVVLHMKYTAKFDGGLESAVRTNVDTSITSLTNAMNASEGLLYAFSLRHDMPNEWHLLKQNGTTNLTILSSRLPYFIQALNPTIGSVNIFVSTDLVLPSGTKNIKMKPTPGGTLTSYPMSLVSGTNTNTYTYQFASGSGIVFGTALTLTSDTSLNVSDMEDIVIVAKINVS